MSRTVYILTDAPRSQKSVLLRESAETECRQRRSKIILLQVSNRFHSRKHREADLISICIRKKSIKTRRWRKRKLCSCSSQLCWAFSEPPAAVWSPFGKQGMHNEGGGAHLALAWWQRGKWSGVLPHCAWEYTQDALHLLTMILWVHLEKIGLWILTVHSNKMFHVRGDMFILFSLWILLYIFLLCCTFQFGSPTLVLVLMTTVQNLHIIFNF